MGVSVTQEVVVGGGLCSVLLVVKVDSDAEGMEVHGIKKQTALVEFGWVAGCGPPARLLKPAGVFRYGGTGARTHPTLYATANWKSANAGRISLNFVKFVGVHRIARWYTEAWRTGTPPPCNLPPFVRPVPPLGGGGGSHKGTVPPLRGGNCTTNLCHFTAAAVHAQHW